MTNRQENLVSSAPRTAPPALLVRHVDPTPAPRRPHPAPRAFTLLELLLVIGIILVLVAMFVGGLNYAVTQGKLRDTRTALETAKVMFSNYQQATRLARTPSALVVSGAAYWTQGQEQAAPQEGVISPDALQLTNPSRIASYPWGLPNQVANTELVMQAFLTIPDNQKMLGNLPTGKTITDATTKFPLLLDGWGNPILFVPGGGLTGVYANPVPGAGLSSASTITSAGINSAGLNSSLRGSQPFFVSAGPDGDVSNAHGDPNNSQAYHDSTTHLHPWTKDDDNLYSFQN